MARHVAAPRAHGRRAEERHDYLEPFIHRAQHDPQRHLAEIVFLLIVFGPVRGSAVKALRNATFVERIDVRAVNRAGQSAAWMVNQMERERLDSAAVEAVLTAIARYSRAAPRSPVPVAEEHNWLPASGSGAPGDRR